MHPRNRHLSRYDLKQLSKICPELAPHVLKNKFGDDSVDFSNPLSVKLLNKAILMDSYKVGWWDIPDHFLCPPIPGRVDYIHYLADLLASLNQGKIPSGPIVKVLDVGVGANCIYPLIGTAEYSWSFVGSEVDQKALEAAQYILDKNKITSIELRLQKNSSFIFQGILESDELFDITMCNPPFHASAEEAAMGSNRKLKNLGLKKDVLNFGGKGHELWCPGGERAFVGQMIKESANFADQVLWFTSLVSKGENLASLEEALKNVKAKEVRIIEMFQGQKKSRFLAWSFKNKKQLNEWAEKRWI
jgi:23S rRNA (adenine1618-N6)-methyltransferase